MNRKLNRFLCLLTILLLPPGISAAADDMVVRTINHLVAFVGASNCVFIRNGEEHNSQEAAKHIKMKYDYFMFNIKTPEAFIEKAASKSIGGQPYWVRCGDHSPILSAEWLTRELSNYRNTMHDKALAK